MQKNRQVELIYLGILAIFSIFLNACESDYLVINPFEAEGTSISYNSPGNDSLNITVVSMRCSRDKDVNIEKIKCFSDSIMLLYPNTELIAYGETITGWYYEKKDYILSVAEEIPGRTTDTIAEICKKHNIYISVGITELYNGLLYNSMTLINPEGEISAIHRKVYLTPEDKESGYDSYKNAQVVQIKNFKTGLMICADVNSLWLTKEYTDSNIDIALSAFASPIEEPDFNIISRRLDAWQVFANRYGKEGNSSYSGLIYVSDPAGNLLKKYGKRKFY